MAKEQTTAPPSWNTIMNESEPKQREEMNIINREFGFGTFTGRILTNWCRTCGKWRIHFVSSARLSTLKGFEPTDESFLCTKCKNPIKLVLDDAHTILRNA